MRIYVSADMEGTAGVCAWPQVDPSDVHEYPVYRRYMTREVTAAIEGAREAGAREFLVNDSHWNMRNLLWDELPPDVRMISGARKPLSMAQGAEQRFDAAFFTGYHAKIGDANAVLSHTYSDATLYDVRVNGTSCTEALLNAALLGLYGTPVVLVTGDRATIESVSKTLPWIVGVTVKDAIGYYSTNTLTPAAACTAIRVGAIEALAALPRAKPFTFDPPVELIVEAVKTEQADFMELLPQVERIGGRAIRFVHDDYLTVFRAFLAAMRLGGAANLPRMKLYCSTDMEGVAGVSGWEQVDARTPHPEYAIYRRYYTLEVAAAIEGARRAGAREVLVNDSHGPMRNLLFDDLPSDIRVIFGNRKPYSMVQDADASFGGAFFIGYHGGVGDRNAVLCHTYTPSVIYELRLNGIVCSETTINAALLGSYGVPLLMITGDRATVEGAQARMPWVHGVIVKESIGSLSADSMSPAAAQRAIADGAMHAIANAKSAKPFVVDAPIEMRITLTKTEQADYVELIPGFERTAPREVRFVDGDIRTVFKAFVATFRLGALA